MRRALCLPRVAGRGERRRWKGTDNNFGKADAFGNPNRYTQPRYRVTESNDKTPGVGSKPQDPKAPEGREERIRWLNEQTRSYQPLGKYTAPQEYEDRTASKFVHAYGDKGDLTTRHKEEDAWLAKRQKELSKRGERIAVGAGVLVAAWVIYTSYKWATNAKTVHPASNVFIGETVELRLEVDGVPLSDPIVVGLFTQRAPAACENFVRMALGNDDRLKLAGTEFFRADDGTLYGGTRPGTDARGGVVLLDGQKTRLPHEDPELPPFKHALVSCQRAFYKNGGFTSTFGILTSDNPRKIGLQPCEDFERVRVQRKQSMLRSTFTGVRRQFLRAQLDPLADGAYAFGILLKGGAALEEVVATVAGQPPMFKPSKSVVIRECRVLGESFGAKERPLTDEDREPAASKAA
ncbi:hypothetical protein DIPPA_23088 [Diplonema papillatum]|nr:hypothetical protein DIPPA_23088 [Diplonema papillatum]KAJ9444944.1 hypothetical protein DIPPA_23088 [Diplonema papillatum]